MFSVPAILKVDYGLHIYLLLIGVYLKGTTFFYSGQPLQPQIFRGNLFYCAWFLTKWPLTFAIDNLIFYKM